MLTGESVEVWVGEWIPHKLVSVPEVPKLFLKNRSQRRKCPKHLLVQGGKTRLSLLVSFSWWFWTWNSRSRTDREFARPPASSARPVKPRLSSSYHEPASLRRPSGFDPEPSWVERETTSKIGKKEKPSKMCASLGFAMCRNTQVCWFHHGLATVGRPPTPKFSQRFARKKPCGVWKSHATGRSPSKKTRQG